MAFARPVGGFKWTDGTVLRTFTTIITTSANRMMAEASTIECR